MLRTETRHAIPTSEPRRLRSASRRTLLVRSALMLALLATLALAFFVAERGDVRHAPLVPSETTGMLVLDLSASVYEGAFAQTLEKIADADERVGVVAFSDTGYELVPPGTPGRELLPLLRFFRTSPGGQLPRNPWEEFRAGTQISAGLEVARQSLLRHGVSRGTVILVSDLEILPGEVARVGEEAALLRRDGIRLRIVPLFPTPEKRARIQQITGSSAVLREPTPEAAVRAPEERSLAAAAPWTFVAVAVVLVGLLAVNEGVLSRLEVGR